MLSGVLSQLGRHDEAIAAAELSVRLEPHNPHRYDRVTWALLAAGTRLTDALDSARTAVALDPESAALRVSYAMVTDRLGRTNEARKALLEALLLDPQHAAARHELATLDVDHGTGWSIRHLLRGAEGYADALHTDPRQHRSRVMLDVALRRFLHLTAMLLGVLSVGGYQLARNDHPSAARLAAAAAVLAPVLLATWFAARLSPAVRSYLRSVVSSGGQLRAVLAALLTAGLLVTAVVGPEGWLAGLLGASVLGGILVRVTTVTEANNHLRAAGVAVPYVLGTVTLTVIAAACALLATVCLAAGEPALTVTGAALAAAGLYAVFVILKRRNIRD